jgi:hypothetical protein
MKMSSFFLAMLGSVLAAFGAEAPNACTLLVEAEGFQDQIEEHTSELQSQR